MYIMYSEAKIGAVTGNICFWSSERCSLTFYFKNVETDFIFLTKCLRCGRPTWI